ncbi:MAG: hypothetical protein HY228_01165 [Candidatus Yonathbacteria bacterium]|nr:hypothetical protein [Candidatus Yonathbacteria bacterium]
MVFGLILAIAVVAITRVLCEALFLEYYYCSLRVEKVITSVAFCIFVLSSFVYFPINNDVWIINGQIANEGGYLVRVPFKGNGWAGDTSVARISKVVDVVVYNVTATTKDGLMVEGFVRIKVSLRNLKEENIKDIVLRYKDDPDNGLKNYFGGLLAESFKKVVAQKNTSDISTLVLESKMAAETMTASTKILGINIQGSVDMASPLHGYFSK